MVEGNYGKDGLIDVRHESGKLNSLFAYRVKPVAPFKVGDKVKCVKYENCPMGKPPVGETGVVTEALSKPGYVRMKTEEGASWLCLPEELEHVKQEEPKKPTLEDFKPGMTVKVTDYGLVTGKTGTIQANPGGLYVIVLIDGKREYLKPSEIEIVEEKETVVTEAIKVGDKVTVDADKPSSSFHGVEGEVTLISNRGNHGYITITKTNDKVKHHSPVGENVYLYNLTKLPEFTFKDIEKGDTIRRTHTFSDGSTIIKEGIVTRLDTYASSDRITLALPTDTNNERVKLELINRPEKPKHWAHTKPVGALAVLRPTDRILAATLTKTGKDEWTHNYVFNNNSRKYSNDLLTASSYGTSESLNWLN